MADLPSRLLVTGARAPVAAHLVRLLGESGHHVETADSIVPSLAGASRYSAAFHPLPSPRHAPGAAAARLEAICRAGGLGMILPTCEEVFHLAALRERGLLSVPVLAPPLAALLAVHDKGRFAELLARLGLPYPATRRLEGADDLEGLDLGSLVLKPCFSRFGEAVRVRPARIDIAPGPAQPWVAQDFVAGEEISVVALARGGRVTALCAYRAGWRTGRHGAGLCCEAVDAGGVRALAEGVAGALGWEGFLSFDTIRRADGVHVAIECNPRPVTGLHFFRDPVAFRAALAGAEGCVAADATGPQAMKLALWAYGLGRGNPLRLWRDSRRATGFLDWPGDPGPGRAQLAVFAAFARRALRQRVSLTRATVEDIAWDG